MPTAYRTLLTLVALASLGPSLWTQLRALTAAGGPSPTLVIQGAVALIPGLVVIALVGRTVLSLLPPGDPGSHRGTHLASTWAASHFLGTAALALNAKLLGLVGLGGSTIALLAPWVLTGALRMAWLPAAARPRRPAANEPAPRPATLLLWLAWGAMLLPLLTWATPDAARSAQTGGPLAELCLRLAPVPLVAPPSIASWPALLVLIAHGLVSARRAPVGRRLLLLLPALVPFAITATLREASVTELPLYFGAGCVFLIPWLRRADRRAACLAVIGFAACGLVSPSGLVLGACGALALWLATPVASKLLVSTVSAIAFGAVAVPGILRGDLFLFGQRLVWDLAKSLTRSPHRTGYWTLRELLGGGNDLRQWGLAWALVGLIVIGYLGLRALRVRRPGAEVATQIDPPQRELWTLLGVGAAGLVVHIALAAWVVSTAEAPWISGDDSNAALLTLLPVALLIVGLIVVRTEDPKRGRRRLPVG